MTKIPLLFLLLLLEGASYGKENSGGGFSIADCSGLQCLRQVLAFATYRFPVNVLNVHDRLTGRLRERDYLRGRLEDLRFEAGEEEHEAEMETLAAEADKYRVEAESIRRRRRKT